MRIKWIVILIIAAIGITLLIWFIGVDIYPYSVEGEVGPIHFKYEGPYEWLLLIAIFFSLGTSGVLSLIKIIDRFRQNEASPAPRISAGSVKGSTNRSKSSSENLTSSRRRKRKLANSN